MNGRHFKKPFVGQYVIDCRDELHQVRSVDGDDLLLDDDFTCSFYHCCRTLPQRPVISVTERYRLLRRQEHRALARLRQRVDLRDLRERTSALHRAYARRR